LYFVASTKIPSYKQFIRPFKPHKFDYFLAGLEKENYAGSGGFSQQNSQQQAQYDLDGFCCGGDLDANGFQRTIKFSNFVPEQWTALYDADQRALEPMVVSVVADKGFNYSAQDNCFVNQKKNHFQVTVRCRFKICQIWSFSKKRRKKTQNNTIFVWLFTSFFKYLTLLGILLYFYEVDSLNSKL
jgi:hypothetical protein